jgi:hypothetical protein
MRLVLTGILLLLIGLWLSVLAHTARFTRLQHLRRDKPLPHDLLQQ